MKTEKKLTTREQLTTVAPNLLRHANGSYYGRKKIDGKIKTHALGTTDRITANGKLREWLGGLSAVDPGNADMNLAMLVEKFLTSRSGLSASTKNSERGFAKVFRASFPRPMTTLVARVTHSDIATWLAKIKPGKRNSTFNRWRLFAEQLFEVAEADGVVKKSPFARKLIPKLRREKVERPIPTDEDFARIIEEIRQPSKKVKRAGSRPMHPVPQPESADFAEFLGRAGVGQAEAASIRWENIDDREMHFTRRKTGKEFRVIITEDLKPFLARRREAAGGASASGPVFKIKSVKHSLNAALRRLGLRHYTQRNFRSMKVVGMLDRGVDVKFIAEQQGHGDGGRLILETYSDVIRKNQRAYEDEQLARMNARPASKVVSFRAVA